MKRIFTVMALLMVISSAVFAQEREYTKKVFHASNGVELPYKILYPENFDPTARYPMMVFLHGSGERGTDNEAQTFHGGKLFASSPELRDVIFIAPQCPWHDYWAPVNSSEGKVERFPLNAPGTKAMEAVKELMDSFINLGFVNTDRIYGTGLSMGGFGILDMTMRYPDFFAAVEPICGGVNVYRCSAYTGRTAFRLFHGLADKSVDPKYSIQVNDVLRSWGIDCQIVTYPGVGHASWHNAFKESDFISWMLKH